MAGNPAFFAALKAKQNGATGGNTPPGGDSKGTPPPFMNGGKKKKPNKGRQDAIARRMASLKR